MKIFLLLATVQDVLADIHDPSFPPYVDLTFLASVLFVATIVRVIIAKLNFPIPCEAIVIFLSMAFGALTYYDPYYIGTISKIVHLNPYKIFYLYVPGVVFCMTFCLDKVLFMKTLPLIMPIVIPVTILSGIIFGSIMSTTFSTWTMREGIIFGLIFTPVCPPRIIYLLNDQSPKIKQICILLEGEALFSIICLYVSQSLILSNVQEYVVYWYQFLAIVIRILLLGTLIGYLFGLLSRYLILKMYTNQLSVSILLFSLPFLTYLVCDMYFSGCGILSVAVLGVMMSTERATLSKELDKFIQISSHAAIFIFEILFICTCAIFIELEVAVEVRWKKYVFLVITYLMYYIVRFACYVISTIIVRNFGYRFDAKSVFVCVLSGIKCPFSVVLARTVTADTYIKDDIAVRFLFYTGGCYLLSILINGSLISLIIKFLGMNQISIAKKINMNICMRDILTRREKIIAILKTDRFLVDTNWPMVIEATTLQHPYKADMETEEEVNFLTYHSTNCPECNKEIQPEPTPNQMIELKRDATLRVLKAKKMSYARQYTNGMISREGIQSITFAVDLAIDSNKGDIQLEDLERKFATEDWIHRCIRKRLQLPKKGRGTSVRPPRSFIRRWCYTFVLGQAWEMHMLWPILCYTILCVVDQIYFDSEYKKKRPNYFHNNAQYSILFGKMCFILLFFTECVMKILAYSWYYIWKHGVHTYFKSLWNIADFVVLLFLINDFTFEMVFTMNGDTENFFYYRPKIAFLKWLRVLRLFRMIEISYPKFLQYLDKKFDEKLAFSYELGKSYVTGEREILELLPYMIDNNEIRTEIRSKIEDNRIYITKLLGTVQKEKPWVAITVKTKQAIRTILKSMNETINKLRTAGWVDPFEQILLEGAMFELYRKVNAIKTVLPSSPKVIFREISWMAEEESLINFLFERVIVKKFEPGDVVFGDGIPADGIYVVVTGLFSLYYNPEKSVLLHRQKYGELPIVDYLNTTKCEEPFIDYIVSGNCIGEQSILTRRPYNCTITADAHSQVYFLSYQVLKEAMNISSDAVTGLECRIWKAVGIRIAIPVLRSVPSYQNFTQDEIKYILEQAFVPNLNRFETFSITEVIHDVILIEGVVNDFHNKDHFVAPCYIPRTIQKLVLTPKHARTFTKLLIIPGRDLDEYDVMATTKETGELVAAGSKVQCLQHAARSRIRRRRKRAASTDNRHIRKLMLSHFENKLPETKVAIEEDEPK